MTPRYAAYGLCAILAVLVSLIGVDSCRQRQGWQAESQAAIHSGEANAHQAQAGASDAKVHDLQAKLEDQKQSLDRLSKERDALLRKLASKPVPHGDPTDPVPGPDALESALSAIADRDAVIAKDAELIMVQAETITKQGQVIQVLTVARDEWKATAEARERQALAQEATTLAWKKAVTTSKWKGRIEGFAAGVALGYVTRGQQ